MFAQILALMFAAAAPPDAAPNTVSPLTVKAPPPTKLPPADAVVDVASDEESANGDFVAIWPALAYQTGAQGHVRLNCKVDAHGLAETCQVVSESPTGKGFAAAALELRPTFKLVPRKGDDGQPVTARMTLNLTFIPPAKELVGTQATSAAIRSMKDVDGLIASQTSIRGNPLAMRKVTMVDDPLWTAAPNFDDLTAAYPAAGGGVEGYVAAHCKVDRSGPKAGLLQQCGAIKEAPHDAGFAKAALSLTPKFRIAPEALARAPHGADLWVDVPIRLPPPAQIADRTVMAPIWVASFDPRATPKLFPPEAVAGGLTTGRGVARCDVGIDGALTACAPEAGDPDGLGFSQAAVKLASTMKMNLWSADGAPVEGGVVHIPIRLNLKPEAK
ncbi:TonB family protein [Phenylobacterium sp.]|jgi:TonB family protein|uniref:TonB family protein n=1 Tax=Phenylobacterium sp. TaxID=1871053 RepID=UPI002E311842|nr:TonB family protein [Phenylobacterium sp.]HEX3366443.1 TonB family protein [Phenylobacterium sp.]